MVDTAAGVTLSDGSRPGMLVLSRKVDEGIDIEGVGRIVLVQARSGRARIGLIFPKGVKILWTELTHDGDNKAA